MKFCLVHRYEYLGINFSMHKRGVINYRHCIKCGKFFIKKLFCKWVQNGREPKIGVVKGNKEYDYKN